MCKICDNLGPVLAKEAKNNALKKAEGGLYAHIRFNSFAGCHYSLFKDLYTVIDGVVYLLQESGPYAVGDCPVELISEKRIGKYNPNKKYKGKIKQCDYGEFMKLIKF